jgi:hypothetical protein
MSIATVDIQSCEDWPRIKQGLQEVLCETDPQFWVHASVFLLPAAHNSYGLQMTSLQLLARGFAVNNASTKDVYATIGRENIFFC